MSVFIFYLGIIIFLIGLILFFKEAFKKNILWGLGSFFFTPVYIVFLIKNWTLTKVAFFMQIIGVLIILIHAYFYGIERTFDPLITLAMIIGHYI